METSEDQTKEQPNDEQQHNDITAKTASLLAKMRVDEDQDAGLSQRFDEEHAHLAISMATDGEHGAFLVTGEPQRGLIEVSPELATQYAQLVIPRWGKESLERFISGESDLDPLVTYQRLIDQLDSLIEFQNPTSNDIVCCWVIGTYLYTLFDAYAYLALLGPMGSGKTKLGTIIEELAFNPIRTSSITPAILFRAVEIAGCTLILDEQDALQRRSTKDDRLALLRDGYKKGGSVLRTREVGRDDAPRRFHVYSPKVIITTSDIDEMLADRCIPIHMLRSTGKQGKVLIKEHLDQLHDIRDELYGLALEIFQQVRKNYQDPGMAATLNNRQRERWLPLLAIAKVFCPDHLPELEEMALQDVGSNILADPIDTAFLKALAGLIVSERGASLAASDISTKMFNLSDLQYPPQSGLVGRLIKKYLGNVGRRSSATGGYQYLITRAQVDDLLLRYPVDDGQLAEASEASEGTEGLSVDASPERPPV
jgi:hypothetical protein